MEKCWKKYFIVTKLPRERRYLGFLRVVLPVMLSQSILDVMIAPQDENSCSRSGWVRCFGRPET